MQFCCFPILVLSVFCDCFECGFLKQMPLLDIVPRKVSHDSSILSCSFPLRKFFQEAQRWYISQNSQWHMREHVDVRRCSLICNKQILLMWKNCNNFRVTSKVDFRHNWASFWSLLRKKPKTRPNLCNFAGFLSSYFQFFVIALNIDFWNKCPF